MTDIVERLRALSAYPRRHDELSIGDEAADEIESLRQQLSDWTRRSESCESKLGQLEANEELILLRQRVQQLETGVNDYWKNVCVDKLSASQAREAKLREALESAVDIIGRFLSDEGWTQEDMNNADWIGWVLIQPQDDSALQEVLNQERREAFLEASDWAENCGEYLLDSTFSGLAKRFREMAEEQK